MSEGLAIYDTIRTSGKHIYCNIEGGCHSMAIVMLLAAPKENRTANPHCRALIHKVSCEVFDPSATADDLRRMAEDMERETNAILDIYADRTGKSRDELKTLMDEEKERTADELLEWGFISKKNSYNTNFKSTKNINKNQTQMAKKSKQEVLNAANSLMSKLKNLLGAKNYDHTDADGNLLFTTDAEDDHLEIGLGASPDGTFTLVSDTSEYPAGTIVVISDDAITEITEPNDDEGGETDLAAANARIAELESALSEAQSTIQDLMAQVSTNYHPNNKRNRTPKAAKTSEENNKNDLRNRLGLNKKEED